MGDSEHNDLMVAMARMEAKLDVVIAAKADHETRLRALETRGYVTGKQLWTGIVGSGTVISAVAAALALALH